VAWGSVHFVLADDESLIVPGGDVRRVYEMLLDLCAQPGALSTAALLIDASRLPDTSGAIHLTSPQSSALRQVVAQLDAAA
jgi:hypothetical protein